MSEFARHEPRRTWKSGGTRAEAVGIRPAEVRDCETLAEILTQREGQGDVAARRGWFESQVDSQDERYNVFEIIARAEWDTLLFFYGVLVCVGGLATLGFMELASTHLYGGLGFTGANIALGVLPLGTLNHFAKDLGLPVEWKEAIAALTGGHRRSVDVGEVNGRMFLNNSGLGVYPIVVADRVGQQKRLGRGKWRAFSV